MTIAVLGGTFDPPHAGHLVAAQELWWRVRPDRLLLVPAAVPPHKRDQPITPGALRLEMLRAAVGDDARFEVSDVELRRDGPSYTVDTLRALRRDHPDAGLVLALGADQVAELATWREGAEIPRLATIAAFARAGQTVPDDVAPGIVRVDMPIIEVSSTDIRDRVARGEPIRYLVPAGVEAVIRREGLYR